MSNAETITTGRVILTEGVGGGGVIVHQLMHRTIYSNKNMNILFGAHDAFLKYYLIRLSDKNPLSVICCFIL